MKNILVVCLLLLFGEALMAQENVLFSLAPQHEVSGYAGTIVAYTKLFSLPNGRYGSDKAALPYARVCLIDGKDTIRLTCDAIGVYFWETKKIPDTLEFHIAAAGFESIQKKYPARREGKNWVNLMISYDSNKVLNEVIISSDKVEVSIQGDTTTYPVENAFKTFEGDWAGDLLRGLPGFSMENGYLTHNGQLIHRVKVNGFEGRELTDIIISNIKRGIKVRKEVQQQQQSEEKK